MPERRGVSERLGALREPQFRLLWIGQTTSAVGDSFIPLAIAFAVLRLGGSAGDIGLVLAAITLPRVLLILVGGVWADRFPRQLVMVISDLIRGAAHAVLALLLLTGTAQLWHLLVGGDRVSAATAFFVPASTGIMLQTIG